MTKTIRAGFSLILLIGSLSLVSCSGPLRIEVTESNPPTFILRGGGSGYLGGITVTEYGESEKNYVWTIYPEENYALNHFRATEIRYGEVPKGWHEEYPTTDPEPPKLVEGKSYIIVCNTFDIQSAFAVFTIKNGKAVRRQD